MSRIDRLVCVSLALLAIALAHGSLRFRRHFIQSFFGPGEGGAPPPRLALPDPAPSPAGLDPVPRVRVVLIDGVGLDVARGMRHFDAICRGGHDLVVDAGFPTVSLPVQHALWTGRTQQQTGVLFRGKPEVLAHPLPPPAGGIPARVPGSVAVAETHPYIVRALGFARTLPPDEPAPGGGPSPDLPEGWPGAPPGGPFLRAARDVVAGDARLAFVHVLRVDTAGHKSGRDSAAYAAAVRDADSILGALYLADAARPGPPARWFVLSDHGHRPRGGHGGAEPSIRRTRACVAGALPADAPAVRPGAYLHMIDLARAIADSAGVALPPDAAGRPLYAAALAPVQPDATLPSPAAGQWLLAAVLIAVLAAVTAAAIALGQAARRPGRLALPWWWLVALAAVVALESLPTLSAPMTYQARGALVYTAAWPGLAWLAVSTFASVRRLGPARAAAAQLALPAGALLAALALAGGLHTLWGGAGEPPLVPLWTAHASAFAVLLAAGAFTVGLVLAGMAITSPAGPGDSEAPGRADP